MAKKKILLLSDDLRMSSGVGTMSREFVRQTIGEYDWTQVAGAIKHPEEGQVHDLSEDMAKETGVKDAYVKVYPTSGYGNPEMIRHLMDVEKPDAIMIYTDPRFWRWLFEMGHEIRMKVPIFYYNIWDDLPYPHWNEPFYESCDLIMNISKQTHNIVKNVWTKFPPKDWQVTCIPHGINEDVFRPIDKKEETFLKFKNDVLNNRDFDFVLLYNNRNIRRKNPGDIILAFNKFVNELPPDEREKVVLVMHTQPVDNNGTDLPAVARMNTENCHIVFDSQNYKEEQMNMLYNLSDVTINIASNEGFGLGTAESLMAGVPIIVNVTGGLQDQCGFKNDDGKILSENDYSKEWGSNHDGRYKECGSWVKPVWPASRNLQGSPPTPYIFDDRCKWEDAADAIMEWYKTPKEERDAAGLEGREYCLLDETGISAINMGKRFIKDMNKAFEEWKPISRYTLYEV